MHLRLIALALAVALVAPQSTVSAAPTSQPSAAAGREVSVDRRTEAVIDGALRYLASKQRPNGSWKEDRHQIAITAYALMAFMSAGHLPDEGEYGQNVSRGARFLLACVGDDGYITSPEEGRHPQGMYGHGIATIVLGELYGQTRDPAMRDKLQKAIDLIVRVQNKEGGWRYQPRAHDADISATVLQVVALRVAKNAGLSVPQETIDKAVKYVRRCQHEESGGFVYMPNRKDPGYARTAAAIYSLQVCGLYDDPMVAAGSKYLEESVDKNREWFTYGSFYAAPAQYMIGGKTWENWYARMSRELLGRTKSSPAGIYWEPIDRKVGDIYATSVYTTILAMPYHYVPLYQR